MDRRRIPPSYTCTCGKRGYFDRKQAKRVVSESRRIRDDPNASQLNTYRCAESRMWHVGHSNPAVNWPNLNDPRLRFLPGEI
jgi:hypothetical protein